MNQEEYNALTDEVKLKLDEVTKIVNDAKAKLNDLNSTSETINTTINDARVKLDEINVSTGKINANVVESVKNLDELKTKVDGSQQVLITIQEIQKNIEEIKQAADSKKKEIDDRVNEVTTFYNDQYVPVRNKINDTDTGLQATLSEAQQNNIKMNGLADQAKIHFDNLENSVEQYKNTLKSLNEAQTTVHTLFETSRATADDILNQIRVIKADTDKLLQDIKDTEVNAKTQKNNIDNLFTEADNTKSEIINLKSEAQRLKENINTIYEQASNDTQGGAFGTQVVNLKNELISWEDKIRNYTIILLCIIIALFVFQTGLNGWKLTSLDSSFYLRFLFTTPIIFYLAFCTKQYSIIRTYLDRYSFKMNIALSVQAHTELLKSNFPNVNNERERYDFSLSVLHKIYEPPYYDEIMKTKDKRSMYESKFGSPIKNEEINIIPNGKTNGKPADETPIVETPNV